MGTLIAMSAGEGCPPRRLCLVTRTGLRPQICDSGLMRAHMGGPHADCELGMLCHALRPRFRRGWLAWLWRRAVMCGVELAQSEREAEYWQGRLTEYPTTREMVDVAQGMQLLRERGVEGQMWQRRRVRGGKERTGSKQGSKPLS